MIDIVLCATQRCGSTMIVEDMRNCKVLGNPEEWFISWSPDKSFLWTRELRKVLDKASGNNGLSAVKLMANQLENVDSCLRIESDSKPDEFCGVTANTLKNSRWIHIERLDVVAQAISRIMARQTGVYHATASLDDDHFAGRISKGIDSNYNIDTQYRYESILEEIVSINLENLTWQHFFSSNKITPLRLVYEEYSVDTEMQHLDKIARFVGLDHVEHRSVRKMVKMANGISSEWRTSFFQDAVQRKFRRNV